MDLLRDFRRLFPPPRFASASGKIEQPAPPAFSTRAFALLQQASSSQVTRILEVIGLLFSLLRVNEEKRKTRIRLCLLLLQIIVPTASILLRVCLTRSTRPLEIVPEKLAISFEIPRFDGSGVKHWNTFPLLEGLSSWNDNFAARSSFCYNLLSMANRGAWSKLFRVRLFI